MLDNMDGLSSGVVIISSLTVAVLSVNASTSTNVPIVVDLSIILSVALFGFWLFNKHPAKIFMGDSGSLVIGYFLAAISIPSELNNYFGIIRKEQLFGSILVLLIPVSIVAIPIFDTTLVTITRKWRAQKASQGGKDHSSHRLVVLGFSETTSVYILYGLALFGGIIAVMLQQIPDQVVPILLVFLLVLILSGVYLGHVKVSDVTDKEIKPRWTPIVSYLLYKRRVAEVLMDLLLIASCYYTAFLLRHEWILTPDIKQTMTNSLPIVISACLLSFFVSGVYRNQWRLISFSEISSYVKGVFGGVALSIALVTLFNRFEEGQSRNAYLIFSMLLFISVVGSRSSFRYFEQITTRQKNSNKQQKKKPILIYGAGKSGKSLADEIIYNSELQDYKLTGYIDDDPNKAGMILEGVYIRSVEGWKKQKLGNDFEIWVSSRFIPKEKTIKLRNEFTPSPIIRRKVFTLELEE